MKSIRKLLHTTVQIYSYRWDFGDDTNGSGQTVSHVYTKGGVYPVTLMVIDSSGQQTAYTTLVGVGEDPLVVKLSGGLGLKIGFTNPVDVELKNFAYEIELDGFVFPNVIHGVYQSIPIGARAETTVRLLGVGFGTVHVEINGYSTMSRFLILGPLVKIINIFQKQI